MEMASHLLTCYMAIKGVTVNKNTEKTQALYMTFLIQEKMTERQSLVSQLHALKAEESRHH